MDFIDSHKLVKFRLYRQHTIQAGNVYLKDLNKLGRDISKIIIVDNVANNFRLQSENGILIKSWIGDPKDEELKKLAMMLKGNE